MLALIQTIVMALDLYWWVIIASAIFSWLYAFNVVNSRNQFVRQHRRHALPADRARRCGRIRRSMPDLGCVDISPIILLLILVLPQAGSSSATIAPLLLGA